MRGTERKVINGFFDKVLNNKRKALCYQFDSKGPFEKDSYQIID